MSVKHFLLLIFVQSMLGQTGCSPSIRTPVASVESPTQGFSTLIPSPMVTLTSAASGESRTPVPTTPSGPLEIISTIPESANLYKLVELTIKSEYVPINPFDPGEFEISVEFSGPSGQAVDAGAFWFQDYYAAGGRKGEAGWRVRFTPTEAGEWTAIARVPSREWESQPVRFNVAASNEHGFVRINANNLRYFAFDDGSFFFPIGLNMAWWSGAGNALTDYTRWLDPFSANGGNTIRVWMADWSFGIEWKDTGLGDYSQRLQRAWLLDQVFKIAEERDVYVLLVLMNCADFNDWQTKGWTSNPYNAANGGPLDNPQEYLTDPTARALTQRRINYIANRWGYSTRIFAWEWWNEANLGGFSDQALAPWLQEMTAYLLQNDPNQHLVTNSFAISDTSPIWLLPEMDIIQKHEYALQENTPNKDLAERVAADLEILAGDAPPKPALMGEFGWGGNEGYGNEIERSGIHLHNGIWATTFAGYAGSGMYWWWDVYVEKYNLWHHFRGLSNFIEGVDLSLYTPFNFLTIRGASGEPGLAFGMGLRGEDRLVWLRSSEYTQQAAEAAWVEAGKPSYFWYQPPLRTGLTLELADMEEGTYSVRWYLPQTGTWCDPVEITAREGHLVIPIPDFRADMAASIEAK
jgi:hypothetical protein